MFFIRFCLISSTLELTCTFETDRVLRFEDSAHCDSATLGNENLRSKGYALHAYGFLYTTRVPELNYSSGAVQNERFELVVSNSDVECLSS